MHLSVLITAAPDREALLAGCLESLTWQTFKDFEVLVMDDGSFGGEAVVKSFQDRLNIRYFWRPNDCIVNRSRNQGLAAAHHEHIVMLDGDVLLNPLALEAYAYHLPRYPNCLLAGYFGYSKTHVAPSQWRPNFRVNYLDNRFDSYSRNHLEINPDLQRYPGRYFWGANTAYHRSLAVDCGGFNTEFVGWGNNDTEFAQRALWHGYYIHFIVDTWAEHQEHGRNEKYHQIFQNGNKGKEYFRLSLSCDYPVEFIAHERSIKTLMTSIFKRYLPHDYHLNPAQKEELTHPQAILKITSPLKV